jgi:hypothetical protein
MAMALFLQALLMSQHLLDGRRCAHYLSGSGVIIERSIDKIGVFQSLHKKNIEKSYRVVFNTSIWISK